MREVKIAIKLDLLDSHKADQEIYKDIFNRTAEAVKDAVSKNLKATIVEYRQESTAKLIKEES